MNKNLYRIVFNKRRGMLMVVGEHASSQGKAAAGESTGGATGAAGTVSLLRPVGMALYAALGALAALPLHAQVVADPNAPGNQRPTVLTTSSGVAQVDIQTPSAAGVSRNTYTQFDVNSGGVILNNSRTDVQTQIGGWVSGNGSLAGGSARVILNEVNSSNPSRLGGFVEVAGQRAEVIIANPAGLQVDGGGFINASRVTLTTGTPVMNGGSLDGFMVQRGRVLVSGRGLDASQTDYTAILARAVQVNAGIWAKELRVVSGLNQLDAAHAVTGKLAGSDAAPNFALDVAALGGMYAGKITLIGTEAGLGVRNAGTVAASSGPLVLQADGWLGNSGALQAAGAVELTAGGGVENSGAVYAGGDTRMRASGAIVNSGRLAAGANTALQADGAIVSGAGSVLAAGVGADSTVRGSGDLTLDTANGVTLHGTAVAAGTAALTGGVLDLAGAGLTGAAVSLNATGGDIDARGATLNASGLLAASAAQTLRFDAAGVVAGQLQLTAHDLSNVGGDIAQLGTGDLTIALPGKLDNTGGRIAANSGALSLHAATLGNSGGTVSHAGSGRFAIEAGRIDGQGGTLAGNGRLDVVTGAFDHRGAHTSAAQLALTAATLDNSGGTIAAAGDAAIAVAGAVDNTDGTLAGGALTLRAGDVDNSLGHIQAVGADGTLDVGALQNAGGTLSAAGTLATRAASLDNSGSLYAGADHTLDVSGKLSNTGMIAARGDLTLGAASIAGSVDSLFGAGVTADGALGTAGNLKMTATGALAAHGQLLAASDAVLRGAALDLSRSEVGAAGLALQADAGSLDTRGAHLAASGTLAITLDAAAGHGWNNAGGAVGAGQIALRANYLDNTGGSIAQLGSGATDLQLAGPASRLDNAGGRIDAAGAGLRLRADSITNAGGSIGHSGSGSLSATAGLFDNSGGLLHSSGAIALGSGRFLNTGAAVHAGGDLALRASGDLVSDGLLYAGGNASLDVGGLLENTGSIAARGDTTIVAGSLDSSGLLGAGLNADGSLAASADLAVTTSGALDAGGENLAAGSLALRGASVNLSGSDTTARDIVLDATAGEIDTRGATVAATDSLTASGAALRNAGGQISGADVGLDLSLLDNAGGAILQAGSGVLRVDAATLENTAGRIAGDGSVRVGAGDLVNAAGSIAGTAGLTLNAGDVDNSAGQLRSSGGDVSLTVRDLVNAGGTVHAGANLSTSARTVANSGSLYANGDQSLSAGGAVANIGVIAAGGNTTLAAASLASNGLLGAGLKADGSFASGGALDVSTIGTLQAGGRNLAAGSMRLDGAALDLSGSETRGARIALAAATGNIDTTAALAATGGTLDVEANGAGQTLRNEGGVLSAGQLALRANAIDNAGGAILQTGSGDTTIRTGALDNTGGRIAVNSNNLTLEAAVAGNAGGELEHAGAGSFVLRGGPLDNRGGNIASNGALELASSGYLDNTGGTIAAAASLRLQGGIVDNSAGLLHAGSGNLDLGASVLLNAAGEVSAGGNLGARVAGDLLSDGLLYAGGSQTLNVGGTLVNDGAIVSLGDTGIAAGAIDSTGLLGAGMRDDGSRAENGKLTLSGTAGVIATGQNLAGGDIAIGGAAIDLSGSKTAGAAVALDARGGMLDTSRAVVGATAALAIEAGQLLNMAGQLSGGAVTVDVARLDNLDGAIVQAGAGEMQVDAGALDNTAGRIAAASGSLELNAADIDNTGGLLSGAIGMGIAARDIDNTDGEIRAAGGKLTLAVRDLDNGNGAVFAGADLDLRARDIASSGSLYAAGKGTVTASGAIANSGAIAARGNLDIGAGSLASSDLLGAGILEDGSLAASGDLTVTTSGALQAGGLNLAAGRLALAGATVAIAGSDTSAQRVDLAASSGGIDTSGALVTTPGILSLDAAQGSALNEGGTLSAGQLDLRVAGIDNRGGSILQSGGGDTAFATGVLNNEDGRIAVNSVNLSFSATALDNAGGRIEHAGAGTLALAAGTLDNTDGRIRSEGAANVAATGRFDNVGGVMGAARDLRVTGAAIDNSAGLMAATAGALTVDGASLLNEGGELSAGAGLRLDLAGDLVSSGLLYAGTDATLSLGGRLRNSGSIAAFGNTAMNAASVDSSGLLAAGLDADGRFAAGGDLTVASTGDLGATGQNLAAGSATLRGARIDLAGSETAAADIAIVATAGDVDTGAALVRADGTLAITAAALKNAGGDLSGGALALDLARLDNSGGDILQKGAGDLLVDVAELTNDGGRIAAAAGSLDLAATALDNRGGRLLAARDLHITANSFLNAGGQTQAAGGSATLNIDVLNNGLGGSVFAAGDLHTHAATVDNAGSLYAGGNQTLDASGAVVSGGVIAAQGNTTVTGASLDAGTNSLLAAGMRADGSLLAAGNLVVATTGAARAGGQNLAGGHADLSGRALDLAGSETSAANITLTAAGGDIDTGAALVTTAGALSIAAGQGGALLNAHGTLSAGQLGIAAGTLDNGAGTILQSGSGDTTLAAGTLVNTDGRIGVNSRNLVVDAARLENAGGRIEHAGSGMLSVRASGIDNRAGRISSATAADIAGTAVIDNSGGVIAAADSLRLGGGALVNDGGLMQAANGVLDLDAASLANLQGELNAGGDMRLALGAALTSSGLLYAGGNQTLDVGGTLRNDGSIAARGDLTVDARSLDSVGLFGAGMRADGSLAGAGKLAIDAAGSLAAHGQNLAAGSVALHGASVDLSGSDTAGSGIDILARSGDVDTSGATVSTGGRLAIAAAAPGATLFNNAEGELGGAEVSLGVTKLDNSGGVIRQSGAGEMALNLSELDNAGGRIAAANGKLAVNAGLVDNSGGVLAAATDVAVTGGDLINDAGQVQGLAGDVRLQLRDLHNLGGSVYAGATLATSARDVDNGGSLFAAGSQTIAASGTLTNSGVIAAQNDLTIAAASLDGGAASLLGAGIRADGTLGTGGTLAVSTTGTLHAGGQNMAGANASLSGASVNLAGSETSAADVAVTARAGAIDTGNGARVTAAGTLTLSANATNAQAWNNVRGDILAAQLQVQVANLNNAQGQIVQTGSGNAAIVLSNPGGTFDNSSGRIAVNSAGLTLGGNTFLNVGGLIEHAGTGTLAINAGRYNGQYGGITGNGSLVLNAATIDHRYGQLSAQQVAISATTLDNRLGRIVQRGAGQTGVAIVQALDNREGRIGSNGNTTITAGSLNNAGGALQAAGGAALTLSVSGLLTNSGTTGLAPDGMGRGIGAGGNTTISAGSVDNAAGLATAGGALALTTGGALNNTDGTLAAEGNLTASAASLDNSGGQLGSVRGNLTLGTGGATVNTNGRIQAGGTAGLTNAGMDNEGGTVSGREVGINTGGQVLSNVQGTIASTLGANLQTGALNNDGGRIQSGTTLLIDTHGQALTNTNAHTYAGRNPGYSGGISGAGAATLYAGSLNNAGGFLGAGGQLGGNIGYLTNNWGEIAGMAGIGFDIGGLNNQDGRILAVGGLTLNAGNGAIGNYAGLLRAGGTANLNAASIDNRATLGADKGIEGQDVAFATPSLNNSGGALRANNNLTVTSAETVENSWGLMSAHNSLAIQDPNGYRGLAVYNTGGTLISDQLTTIRAASLSGAGRVLSTRDLALDLPGNYTLEGGAELIGNGNVSLALGGGLWNYGKLQAAGTLTLNAASLENTAGGDINAGITRLNAGSWLTNRGVIDGINTEINTGTLNNFGTGRIYGDRISIGAGTLNNDVEGGTAGTVAARNYMALGVQTLNNREHALIFSGGDMNIGGWIDGYRNAYGSAAAVTNASATIEALGSMVMNATRVDVLNNHFDATPGTFTDPQLHSAEYVVNNVHYAAGTAYTVLWGDYAGGTVLHTPGGKTYTTFDEVITLRSYATSVVRSSDPGVLAAGIDLTVNSGAVLNDNSQVVGGRGLYVTPGALTNRSTSSQTVIRDNINVTHYSSDVRADAELPESYDLPDVVIDEGGAATFQRPALTAPGAKVGVAVSAMISAAGVVSAAPTSQVALGGPAGLTTVGTAVGQSASTATGVATPGETVRLGTTAQTGPLGTLMRDVQGATLSGLRSAGATGAVMGAGGVGSASAIAGANGSAIETGGGAIGEVTLAPKTAFGTASGVAAVAGAGSAGAIALGTGSDPVLVPGTNGKADIAARKEAGFAATVAAAAATPSIGAIVAMSADTKVGDSLPAAPAGAALTSGQGVGGAPVAAPKPGPAKPDLRGIAQVPLASPTASAEVVRTTTLPPTIPNASLYQISPAPQATYLVETDPRFANYREWTSADYLIGKVSTDPSVTQKRLGDGFYEQQLVREQMTALTGYRYNANYTSDEEQYRGLMDAAALFAQTWNIRPGVALSDTQMGALTSDIVWLVEQNVALADGSTQKVLVPQVYVRVREGDLDGSGALLSGREVDIKLSGDLVNSGTIAGRDVVRITAENIDNLSGRIHGDNVNVQARNDLNNISGTISASSSLIATAGRDLNIATGVANVERGIGGSIGVLGRVAGLYITGSDGTLTASAGRDLNLAGGIVSNAGGTASLGAGRDLNLHAAVATSTSTAYGGMPELQTRDALITSGSLQLRAGNDINNVGTSVTAEKDLFASAGRDINLRSTTTSTAFDNGRLSTASTTIDKVASLNVTGAADGKLIVSAGRDINLAAGIIGNASEGGITALSAERDLNLGTVGIASRNDLVTNANNYRKESTTSEIGSQITGAGSILLKAGNNLSVRAGEVDAGTSLAVAAGNNIDITTGVATYALDQASQTVKKKTFSKKVTTKRDTVDASTSIASALTGGTVSMSAGNDLNITGSAVVGEEAVALAAGNGINIAAAVDTNREWNQVVEKKSGFLSGGGGFGISYGTRTTTTDQNKDAVTQSGLARSMVGSIGGNLTLDAGNAIKVGGTDMSAGGNMALAGKSVTIDPGKDQIDGRMETRTVQDALTLKVGGSVVNAIQAVQGVQDTVEATGNKRVQAMAAATAAMATKNAAADIAKEGGPSISLSLTAGHSESATTRTTSETLHTGSTLAAGNDLTIVAKGDGANSDINIVGSQLSAGRNVTLAATDQVNLLAAQDLESQHSEIKSFSAEAGVKATVGTNGMAFGITASVSGSRGHEDGSGTTQVNSSVKAAEKLTIVSGGDTNIKGAVAAGAQVVATVGGDLNIESLQDSAKFDSKTQSASISGTFGAGASVSGSFSQSSIKSDYASVQEQSGIRAGDGGFQINVGGNTGLKGGVISSTADGVAANMLTTRTLTESDIANYAKMQATSIGLSGTVTSGGGDSKPKTGEQAASTAPPAGQGQGPGGTNLIDVANTSAPTGVTPSGVALSSNDKSTTSSGISAGTIVITDDAAQRALTGEGAEEAIAALGRDVVAGTDSSGRINNAFDRKATQTALRVTEEFVAAAAPLAAKLVGDLGETKKEEAKAAAKELNRQAGEATAHGDTALAASLTAQAETATQTAAAWGDDGVNRVALHAAAQGAIRGLGGGSAGALSGVSGVVGGDLGKQFGEFLANAQSTGLTDAERVSLVDSYKHTMATVGGAVAGLVTAAGTEQAGIDPLAGAIQAGITGLDVDKNNRRLHQSEADKLALAKKGKSAVEQHRLDAAACALVHCADGVPTSDPNYASLAKLQTEGQAYVREQTELKKAGEFNYNTFQAVVDARTQHGEAFTRLGGLSDLVSGTVGTVGGGAMATAGAVACPVTLLSCAGVPVGGYIAYKQNQVATAGSASLFGTYKSTEGAMVLASFSPATYPGGSYGVKDLAIDIALAGVEKVAGKVLTVKGTATTPNPGSSPVIVPQGNNVLPNTQTQVNTTGSVPNAASGNTQVIAKVNSGRSPYSEINGAIGEFQGYDRATNGLGHIGIQAPGKTSVPGRADYLTLDTAGDGTIFVWDSKYRAAENASYPKSIPQSSIDKWMPQVEKSIRDMPPGPAKDMAIDALNNGRVVGRVFKWPQ